MMRNIAWLMVGAVLGMLVQSGSAQQRNSIGLNHIAIAVQNFDEAAKFYTDVMGFRQAFLFRDASGPDLAYFQVNQHTFVELMAARPDRPAGFAHYGLEVANLDAEVERLRGRGLRVSNPTVSARSGARGANFTTPHGTRVEMFEFGPDSLQRKAMESWRPFGLR